MYFPFLRGRQYELLGLKELVQRNLLGNYVIPVVEPVKISSTLKSTLEAFKKANKPLALVLNPSAVNMEEEDRQGLISFLDNTIIPAVIVDESFKSTIDVVIHAGFAKTRIMVVFASEENTSSFNEQYSDSTPLFCLGPDKRFFRNLNTTNKVLFNDNFNKQNKNSDYAKKDDELFSEDHLNFEKEGYVGFGDYSIIGAVYDDNGFAPRAVAIHIVYFDSSESLRVHHFVSDTNYGIKDVAGKFYEAIKKLNTFSPLNNNTNSSSALDTLRSYANSGYYPGLAILKKLSIMHHIEILNHFLRSRD